MMDASLYPPHDTSFQLFRSLVEWLKQWSVDEWLQYSPASANLLALSCALFDGPTGFSLQTSQTISAICDCPVGFHSILPIFNQASHQRAVGISPIPSSHASEAPLLLLLPILNSLSASINRHCTQLLIARSFRTVSQFNNSVNARLIPSFTSHNLCSPTANSSSTELAPSCKV